jgi:hypothetical protein
LHSFPLLRRGSRAAGSIFVFDKRHKGGRSEIIEDYRPGFITYAFIVSELPIIERTFDLIKWYIPILNRLPREHKFVLGDRIATNLYDLLDGLILARYASNKSGLLDGLNTKVDLLRYQSRLLLEFGCIYSERYIYASQLLTEIGKELGGWAKQQRQVKKL